MTIYDADYIPDQYVDAGVTNQAAADQANSQPYSSSDMKDPLEASSDTSTQQDTPQVDALSDKEMNFRAMRDEIAKIKAEKQALEENFDVWKRDLASNNVRREPEPPRKRAIDELPDDDLITGAQVKRLLIEQNADYQRKMQEQEVLNEESRVKSKYSDYDEVASKYGIPLMKQDPDLYSGFMASQNKASYLYKIGKMAMNAERASEPIYEEPVRQEPQVNRNAQRMLDNSRKPGTLSSAVGGQSAISRIDYYSNMSDEDFHKVVAKNLEQV